MSLDGFFSRFFFKLFCSVLLAGFLTHSSTFAQPSCKAQFTSPDTVCAGDTLSVQNQSTGDSLVYNWTFKDTSGSVLKTRTKANPAVVFDHTGTGLLSYDIQLIVVDTTGCRDTLVKGFILKPRPTAQFVTDSSRFCKQGKVNFTDSSKGNGLRYRWDFGDPSKTGDTASKANPAYQYTDTGIFKPSLKVTNGRGCDNKTQGRIIVAQPPVADFEVKNNCLQLSTEFSAKSRLFQDTAVQWNWDFGDNTTGNGPNPTHQYSSQGTFAVSLTVTLAGGCVDSVTDSVTIHPTPSAGINDTTLCNKNNVGFSGTKPSSATSFTWKFDDGKVESRNLNPFHIYNQKGGYQPRLAVTFPDNRTCEVKTDSLKVFEKPRINAQITTADTQCSKGNKLCLLDSTSEESNIPLASRSVVFGDGSQSKDNGSSVKTFCHSYTKFGNTYDVNLTITNQNGCKASKSFDSAIFVRNPWQPSFTTQFTTQCFGTPVTFNNQTTLDSSRADSFRWDFGDGTFDTSRWTNFTKTYNQNGSFSPTLTVTSQFGCTKSFSLSKGAENVDFQFDVNASADTLCFSNNSLTLSQPPISNADFTWFYGDGSTENQATTGWTTTHSYNEPGQYVYQLQVSNGQCDTLSEPDTVEVVGVKPELSEPINAFQCGVRDSVVFVDPGLQPYESIHYGAPNTQRLWDFGDTAAPSCTTNTAQNKNVSKNCRYSRDSIQVIHEYQNGLPDCYTTTLTFTDTVTGCSSSTTTEVSLVPPEAGPDTAHDPPLEGASFNVTDECLGPEPSKAVSVSFVEVQPQCEFQEHWVMWDSACARQSGNFSAQWEQGALSHNYDYDEAPCESDGTRTIGLVIRNGTDSNGNFCQDTAWYTDEIRHNEVDPRFSSNFSPSKDRCPPVKLQFSLDDTVNQDSVTEYEWRLGGDTIVKSNPTSLSYTFDSARVYQVGVTLTQSNGCQASITAERNGFKNYGFGFRSAFNAVSKRVCKGQPVNFRDSVKYWDTLRNSSFNSTEDFWGKASRRNAGLETLKWDFGDGQGFRAPSHNPSHVYDTIGAYDVRLAIKDSSGCRDTITKKDFIRVFGINADFTTKPKKLICTPEAQFIDSSRLVDSGTNFTGHPGDSVVQWEWRFGDNKPKSFVADPVHNYTTNDTFDVTLIAQSNQGCVDSVTKRLKIPGPEPKFEILAGDTLGCKPHKAVFKNQSSNASSYIWQFGNPNNNVLSTRADTNVNFTYQQAGSFPVFLVAQDSVKNPVTNAKEFCSATFPDTTTVDPRSVVVRDQPGSAFSVNVNCDRSVSFFENAVASQGSPIQSYQWVFDTLNTSQAPDTNITFPQAGDYKVELITTNDAGCQDTASQKVSVPFSPKAGFQVQRGCAGEVVSFKDQSSVKKDTITQWIWNLGDGTTKFSENPNHTYTTGGKYKVKLTVVSSSGCQDTVTQTVAIPDRPTVAFSTGNQCANQDLQLQNNTTTDSGTLSYKWNFGDGTSATSVEPTKKYNAAGSYDVTLIADVQYTNFTCKDSLTNPVNINPTPKAQFSASNTCLNKAVNFTDQSTISPSGSINSYNWDFGDGNGASSASPDYQYSTDGTYQVELVVTSAKGCSDTTQQSLQVYPVPAAGFSASDNCEDDTVQFQNNASIKQGTLSYKWAFGDGSTSTKPAPENVYKTEGNYNVEQIATSNNGCEDTANQILTIYERSQPAFSFADTCEDDTVAFTNNTTGPAGTNYQWNFGDGSSSTQENPDHVYDKNGNYNVELISTTPNNCTDTLSRNIAIFPDPDAGYSVTNNCVGAAIQFKNRTTVDSGSLSYQWQFGDGSSSLAKDPANTYNSFSTFNVSLQATTNQGCSDDTSGTIKPYPLPSANFTVRDTCEQEPHSFQNQSTIQQGTLSYQWSFGDGTQSNQSDPAHRYAKEGTYKPQLTATSNRGCVDSQTQSLQAFNKPNASFGFTNQCQPKAIPFQDQSSTASGNSITGYAWDFDDGSTSTVANPTHTYNQFGTYAVSLVVTNNKACKDTAQQTVNSYAKPRADFSATTVCETQPTPFQDQSTIADGKLSSWSWRFENTGGQSTKQNPSYTYPDGGQFQPRLIVTSDENCKDTFSRSVTVDPTPEPAFTVNDTCLKQPTAFEDTSTIQSGSIANRTWELGDGTQVAGQLAFSHTYPQPKTYQPQLTATSAKGCVDSLQQKTVVQFLPEARFTSDTVCRGEATSFKDGSTVKQSTVANWQWRFGDGGTSMQQNPKHFYTQGGQYPTRLVVTSAQGCLDTAQKQTIVYFKPQAAFSVSPVCFPDSSVFKDQSSVTNSTIQGWNWDFGDGTKAGIQDPVHQYAAFGSYETQLIVTSAQGCKDTVIDSARVNPKPTSDFTFSDTCQPNPIDFTDKSRVAEGEIVAYGWEFGDKENSTMASPIHPYDSFGRFRASLGVRTNKGCVDTTRKVVEVFPKPVARFTAENVCRVDTAIFKDTSSVAGQASLRAWGWQLGDSTGAAGDSVSHTYAVADTYDVQLIVTTTNGCKDTAVNPLTIYPMPQSGFTTNDTTQCLESEAFNFTNETTIQWGTNTYRWRSFRLEDSAKADTANTLNYQRQFNDTGDYEVRLKATSNFNCVTRDSQLVQVFPDPEARMAVTNGCINAPLKLTDQSTVPKGFVDSWQWRPGNDTLQTSQNPEASYDTGGVYEIRLVATTNIGCDDTAVRRNRVYGVPEPATMRRVTVRQDSFVRIEWTPSPSPNPGFYELYRSTTGISTVEGLLGSFQPRDTLIRDFDVLVDSQSYYYTLNFVDSCGIPYPHTTFGRTINMDVETDIRFPELTFNKYEGWASGVQDYQIQWRSDRVDGFEPVSAVDTNIFKDSITREFGNPYCYRVVARKADSAVITSVSNVKCVNAESKIFIPEAFSPNNDGNNDRFRPQGSFVLDYNLKIYNRWGELVFESNDRQKAWDGTYQGEEAPTGVYQYVVKVQGTEAVITKSGTVTLIR